MKNKGEIKTIKMDTFRTTVQHNAALRIEIIQIFV